MNVTASTVAALSPKFTRSDLEAIAVMYANDEYVQANHYLSEAMIARGRSGQDIIAGEAWTAFYTFLTRFNNAVALGVIGNTELATARVSHLLRRFIAVEFTGA